MIAIDELLRSLDFDDVGPDRYRVDAQGATNSSGTLFGGQLMAQVVAAALRGQDGKRVKTLHVVFARGGSPDHPVDIAVERIHDGRSLGSCTVTISQGERVCTRGQLLLTADDDDFIRHADPAPELPPLPDDEVLAVDGHGPWQICFVDDVDLNDPGVGPPDLDVWMRFPDAPDDPVVHQALLAYGTDPFLIGTAMRPHEGVSQAQSHVTVQTGVLSHTLTYHDPVRVDDWLLVSHHSPYAGRGRSYGRADVLTRNGALVASFVQDAVIRPKR